VPRNSCAASFAAARNVAENVPMKMSAASSSTHGRSRPASRDSAASSRTNGLGMTVAGNACRTTRATRVTVAAAPTVRPHHPGVRGDRGDPGQLVGAHLVLQVS